jgi:hypothetical protein
LPGTSPTTSATERLAEIEFALLVALLLLSGPSREPEHEPQVITFGPCCGPPGREAEAEAE